MQSETRLSVGIKKGHAFVVKSDSEYVRIRYENVGDEIIFPHLSSDTARALANAVLMHADLCKSVN